MLSSAQLLERRRFQQAIPPIPLDPLDPRAASAGPAEAGAPPESPPIAMLGVCFENLDLHQALERLDRMIESRRPHFVVTANVDFVVQALHDVELRHILSRADLALCDGLPLVWASRFLGNGLPERVAGSDLVPKLLERSAARQYRVFLLGSTPESNARAVANIEARYPGIQIAGSYSPPFAPLLEMNHAEILRQVKETRPDVLLVAFGCPKAEKWMSMHCQSLGVPVCIGVGATIDFLAGKVRRAPVWMQRSGLEWLFRLMQEPRRLFSRYATDLWFYSQALARQWWTTRPPLDPNPTDTGRAAIFTERNCHRIHLSGRLDAALLRQDRRLWDRIDDRHHCLLELGDVRHIDSTGVAWLLWLRRMLRNMGRQLILIAPAEPVRRALRGMRIEEFFVAAPDSVEAHHLLENSDPSPAVLGRHWGWSGEVTAERVEQIWLATWTGLHAKSSQAATVPIDLSKVTFMDSAGAALMQRLAREARRLGLTLRFTHACDAVRNVVHHSAALALLSEEVR